MENIKTLMGSAYHDGVTLEEVNSFLAGKNMVDLKSGNYVSKEKFERIETEKKTLQSDYDSLKEQAKDYETLKSENDSFKTEKANADLKTKLVSLGINEKCFNYVKMDIDSKALTLGEDEKANKSAVETYLKEHPEFAVKQEAPNTHRTVVVSTGGNGSNQSAEEKRETVAKQINGGFRDALGLGN